MPAILKSKKYFIPLLLITCIIIFLSLLLAHNAILYFTHGGDYGILPEKQLARQDPFWNICFYTHLPAGIICLLLPWYSFAKILKINYGHQIIGKAYCWITLIIVCPTGFYLAIFAKGGLITQAGFIVQAVLLGYHTWRGYKASQANDIRNHVREMLRSYAVATVVLTFRVLHILFFIIKVPYMQNYAISQWLGLTLNLLLAEIIIYCFIYTKNSQLELKSK